MMQSRKADMFGVSECFQCDCFVWKWDWVYGCIWSHDVTILPSLDALWDSTLYIYCNRWNAASCRVKENSDEWSHSEPGVSFRMGVEANNGSPNELFYYFLSTAAWVPITDWIAPNGSNCGDVRLLKKREMCTGAFSGCVEMKLKNVMGTRHLHTEVDDF